MAPQLLYSVCILLVALSPIHGSERNVSGSARILALFSGTSNELGIDHRLGRQILKLAIEKAKSLHPSEVRDIELIVRNDDTDCNNLNAIPNWVAEQFYLDYSSKESADCRLENDSRAADRRIKCEATDLEDQSLDYILQHRHYESADNRSAPRRKRSDSGQRISIEAESWARGQIDAIIGPSCDYLVDLVARMAAYWRKPMYSVTSVGAGFSRKDIYSTLTRLSPSIDRLSSFLLKVLEKFRWRHLAIIVDTDQVESRILLDNLEKMIDRQRYLIPIERKIFRFSGAATRLNGLNATRDGKTSASLCAPEISSVLQEARRVARVFMLLINDHQAVRRWLLCGYELGMNNGEFSFLAFNLGLRSGQAMLASEETAARTNQRNAGDSVKQDFDWYSANDEANNLIARQMYESLMVFSTELPTSDEYNLFVEQTLDLTHQEYPSIRFDRASVGPVAVALHDSLLLAVEALLRFRRRGADRPTSATPTADSSSLFVNDAQDQDQMPTVGAQQGVPLMWNERFGSGLISNLHVNSNGDQEFDYILSDLEPEMGLMRPVARYSKDKREIELLANSYIHWPMRMNAARNQILDSDEPPPDEPECGFTGEAEHCIDRQNLYAALLVVAVLAAVIALVAGVSLRRYHQIKYQMQLDDYWWRVNWVDLQFLHAAGSLSSNPQSLVRALKSGGSVVSMSNESGSGHGPTSLTVVNPHEAAARRRLRSPSGITNQGSDMNLGTELAERPASGQSKVGRQRRAAISVIVTADANPSQQQNLSSAQSVRGRGDVGSGLAETSCIVRSEFSAVVKASMLAMYRNEIVIVKQLNATTIEVTRELLVELKSIRELICDNLAKFVGLCIEPERLSIVYEYCSRGSLQDMLLNESVNMDWILKYSIIGDLLNGLNFIHTTLLDYHGRLKSTNLVLDSRFTVKITDFGLQNLYGQLEPIENHAEDETAEDDGASEIDDDAHSVVTASNQHLPRSAPGQRKLSVSQLTCNMDSVSMRAENTQYGAASTVGGRRTGGASRVTKYKNRGAMRYYWTAPEHLRNRNPHSCGSKKGDIYALGVILSEILTRKEPYHYGTNSKPHWPTIRKDRRHLNQQLHRQIHGSDVGARSHNLDSDSQGAIGSLIGRQARKAQGKLRRSSASVKPAKTKGTDDPSELGSVAGDAESVVSAASSQHSGKPTANPKKVSVAAIDEEALDEAGEALDELGAIGGAHQARGSETAGTKDSKRIDPEEVLDQLRMGVLPEPVRPYIPNYVLADTNAKLVDLMRVCWAEAPETRPTVGQVRQQLRRLTHGAASKNYLDNLLDRLQNYAANLERIVDSKSADIVEEKQRTEELLNQLVPKFVADKLKRNEPIVPQVFDGVTIFFSDIVGFEKYASVMSPCELVDLLNNIYCSFESIISSFDVTKIEVILDQYLVAAGISLEQHGSEVKSKSADEQDAEVEPERADESTGGKGIVKGLGRPKRKLFEAIRLGSSDDKKASGKEEVEPANGSGQQQSVDNPQAPYDQADVSTSHYRRASAEQIARMALCIRDLVKSFHFRQNLSASKRREANRGTNQEAEAETQRPSSGKNVGSIVAATFNIRIGIHSGKVCAGIVGLKRPKYCLIGDTVNVASRMHTNSKANRIQISADTRELLRSVPGFNLEPRGRIEVKGKGTMETYWLESSY